MHSTEGIASRISDYIQTLPTKTVSGTELAQYLKFSFPGWNPYSYGARNLRVFLERFVPSVVPVGRMGGDILYGSSTRKRDQPAEQSQPAVPAVQASTQSETPTPTLHRELWKAYSSPNSPWRIYANTQTGEISLSGPGRAGLTEPWIAIPPCSPETHLQIAKNFISGLTDENKRETLQKALAQPRWWDQFYFVAPQLGLLRDWQLYRRREILRDFAESLVRLGIPAKSKPVTYPAKLPQTREQALSREPAQQGPGDNDRFRRAVISAVGRMSISELRTLSIPVGYFLDEFRREE